MKKSLPFFLMTLLFVFSINQLHANDKDVAREVRKLRAEAAYQEMKGNLEESLKLFEESLELMPDATIEEKVSVIKEKLGIPGSEPETNEPKEPPVPAEEALNPEEKIVTPDPETVTEPETTPEAETSIKNDTTVTENEAVAPDAHLTIEGTQTSVKLDTLKRPREVGLMGSAYRKKVDSMALSPDFQCIIWDQEEEIEDHDFSRLFINGVEQELPLDIRYFGRFQITNTYDFVSNASLNKEAEGPKEVLFVNGNILGNYYDVEYPELSEDRSTWASILVSKISDPTTDSVSYQSKILVNGEVRAEVPNKVDRFKLSPNGDNIAYSVEMLVPPNNIKRKQVYVDATPIGPMVSGSVAFEWDTTGENVYWEAKSIPDESGSSDELLMKNGEVLSRQYTNYSFGKLGNFVAINSENWAFKEVTENDSAFLVTPNGKNGPWQDISKISLNHEGKLAFVGKKDEIKRIYIDGNPADANGSNWYKVDDFRWSPDGKHWAAVAQITKKDYVVLHDGKIVASGLIKAGNPVFSPNSKRLAAWVRNAESKYVMMVDGAMGPTDIKPERDADIVFSPDSKHVFYWVKGEEGQLHLTQDHEIVPSEGEILPQLYFDENGATWYLEVVGLEPGQFFLRKLD